MADYAARIEALEEAAGSGELTVKADGREVTYRSMTDLLRALSYFRSRQSIASANGAATYAVTLASFGED